MPDATTRTFPARWPAVLAGGVLGAAGRTAVAMALPDGTFPVSTLAVNLAGSLLLGAYLARNPAGPWLDFWAVGVLGSLTTFSAFSLDVVELLDAGEAALGLAYAALSTGGGLAAAAVGGRAGRDRR